MAFTKTPFCQKSGFLDSEKLCGFAPLREKILNRVEWIGSTFVRHMVLGGLELWKRRLSTVPGGKEGLAQSRKGAKEDGMNGKFE